MIYWAVDGVGRVYGACVWVCVGPRHRSRPGRNIQAHETKNQDDTHAEPVVPRKTDQEGSQTTCEAE